jgi:hypothetical protein
MKNKRTEPKQKPYEQPEVVTYDQAELVPDTVFTQRNGSGDNNDSDRNLKTNFRSVNSQRVLARLAQVR